MESQKFCLKWDAFHSSVTSSFDLLRQDEEFVDVTLCCEGQSVRAHKLMLSACSPYFRELLKNNPCQQMVIFLKDTSASDLHAVLEFMYRGSVNVTQAQLGSFIKTAEMLQIRGLSGEEDKPGQDVPGDSANSHPPSKRRRRRSSSPHRTAAAAAAATPAATSPDVDEDQMLGSSDFYDGFSDSQGDPSSTYDSLSQHSPPRPSHPPPPPPPPASFPPPPPRTLPIMSEVQIKLEKYDPGSREEVEADPTDGASNGSGGGGGNGGGSDGDGGGDAGMLALHDPALAQLGDPPAAGEEREGVVEFEFEQFAPRRRRRRDAAGAATQGGVYSCPVCGRGYTNPRSLEYHKKMHAGLTRCALCGKITSKVEHLRRHLVNVHKLTAEDIRSLVPTRHRNQRGVL